MTERNPFRLQDDHFTLFGLARRQKLDATDLATRYQALISETHPDRYAHLPAEEQRRAMQWASRVNEAYATLKDPLKRAIYLLHLAGHDVQLETNTAMPAEFLMEQMERREVVEEARASGDADRLGRLHREFLDEVGKRHEELARLIETEKYDEAAHLVRQLMFEEKLLREIDEALTEVEA